MVTYPELAGAVLTMQNLMISRATSSGGDEGEYIELRNGLLREPLLQDRLPTVLTTCRTLGQFWAYIQQYPNYRSRREALWKEFRPLLDHLEGVSRTPSDEDINATLAAFDYESVHQVWVRALERRHDDPEGAITAARTLLETVCKHILDELQITYDDNCDLPKLYRLVADELRLSPAAHSEKVFKQILGGCQAVVEGLGALRNRLSDAHGKGKLHVRPSPRHAELAVNLAGSAASFLVQTWGALREQPTAPKSISFIPPA